MWRTVSECRPFRNCSKDKKLKSSRFSRCLCAAVRDRAAGNGDGRPKFGASPERPVNDSPAPEVRALRRSWNSSDACQPACDWRAVPAIGRCAVSCIRIPDCTTGKSASARLVRCTLTIWSTEHQAITNFRRILKTTSLIDQHSARNDHWACLCALLCSFCYLYTRRHPGSL